MLKPALVKPSLIRITLRYESAVRWHASGEVLRGIACASLDRVGGRSVEAWMTDSSANPAGGQLLKRLQSEAQMLFYTHPAFDVREALRLHPVNGFWLSGAGAIDHRAFSGMLGYSLGGHKVSAGWQRMYGDSAMPYLDGSNPYLVNYAQVNDFAAAQERSWQVRYDYDFKAVGLDGLSFLTRYINGDHVKVPGSPAQGKEWERDSELKYQVQSGTFKNVGFGWRNGMSRSEVARDQDQNRLFVSYSIPLM